MKIYLKYDVHVLIYFHGSQKKKETTSSHIWTAIKFEYFDLTKIRFFEIPWFFPDFQQNFKFPDFSLQGFFFHHFPCFPECVAILIEEKHYARSDGCRPYSWGDIECQRKMCKRHWSAKYRSRSPGQDTCQVSTSRRGTMQGLVARGLTLEEIWNLDVNYIKVTAAKI